MLSVGGESELTSTQLTGGLEARFRSPPPEPVTGRRARSPRHPRCCRAGEGGEGGEGGTAAITSVSDA